MFEASTEEANESGKNGVCTITREVFWRSLSPDPAVTEQESGVVFVRGPTCLHASFFPFCPLCWPPLFLPFIGTFSPFSSPRKVLCSVEQRAQHTAWRGAVSGQIAPRSSGRKYFSRNLREKRSGEESLNNWGGARTGCNN